MIACLHVGGSKHREAGQAVLIWRTGLILRLGVRHHHGAVKVKQNIFDLQPVYERRQESENMRLSALAGERLAAILPTNEDLTRLASSARCRPHDLSSTPLRQSARRVHPGYERMQGLRCTLVPPCGVPIGHSTQRRDLASPAATGCTACSRATTETRARPSLFTHRVSLDPACAVTIALHLRRR